MSGLTNLTTLELRNNNISDLSPLSGLTNLEQLWLAENTIRDISSLSGLTNLTSLVLENNNISDISPLVENTGLGAQNWSWVNVRGNPLSYQSIHIHIPALKSRGVSVSFDDQAHPALLKISGDNQRRLPGETLTNPFVVEVQDENGSPFVGVSVTFTVVVGSGTLSMTNTTTDSNGRAESTLTLGPNLGMNMVEVRVEGISHITVFSAEAAPPLPIPTTLKLVSGDNQTGVTGEALMQPFVVQVHDQYDDSMEGVTVNFAVSAGEGSLSNTSVDTGIDGLAQSTLTLGNFAGTNTVNVSVEGISEIVTFHAIGGNPKYLLSIPTGTNLIHVPLKVTAVDGATKTIETVGDLYDALGGANAVNYLLTHDSSTQGWISYISPADRGTSADPRLSDQMGILAGMKTSTSIRLTGKPLGNNGTSTIGLNKGQNIVGLPLRDSRITRVGDLLSLEGIKGNVPVVRVTVNGVFKSVGRAGDPDDIAITGGQGFILTAQRAATVTLTGEGWTNDSATAAPSMALTGLPVKHTTPVLALRGSIVDEVSAVMNPVGFHVAVKNLSTGKTVAATPSDDGAEYRIAVVDIETSRAARVSDVLEITAQSTTPFIGVQPLQYAVTAEDVLRGWIQLPVLVAYEIPSETELLANYPNPFNPETWIPYRLAKAAKVTLEIYDTNGRTVRTIDVGFKPAAAYESRATAIYWDGRNNNGERVASGTYFYHLIAGDGYASTRRLVILK